MVNETCVIVGASHAGVSLALQLRREGWEGKIKLIGKIEKNNLRIYVTNIEKKMVMM